MNHHRETVVATFWGVVVRDFQEASTWLARIPVLVFAALMAATLLGRWQLDRWERRVDHRAASGLTRRAMAAR
jgi:cytochrome oxidase assembly protein ShyY1